MFLDVYSNELEGGEYATARTETATGKNKKRLYLSVADSYPETNAGEKATMAVRSVLNENPKSLKKKHDDWWHHYYPASFISVPDAQIEGFYWAQIYKLGCATRQDRHVMDLLGPFGYRDTTWPRIWWNLNIQMAYSPVYPANRLELGESVTRFIDAKRDELREKCQRHMRLRQLAPQLLTPQTTRAFVETVLPPRIKTSIPVTLPGPYTSIGSNIVTR